MNHYYSKCILAIIVATTIAIKCSADAVIDTDTTGKRILKRAKKKKDTPSPTAAPTISPFPVSPFAVMGTTHTAVRGWISEMQEDCFAAVQDWTNSTKLDKTIETVETLKRMIGYHMQHEEEGFFLAVDNTFSCVAHDQGYRDEHDHDNDEQVVLTNMTAKLTMTDLPLSTAQEVCGEIFLFSSEHEAHLKHEENYLSPLTKQFPTGSPPAIVHFIMMTNFDSSYDYFAATALEQLVKRSSFTTVGTYITAIQRVLTPTQYEQVLPSIIAAVGDLWPQLAMHGLDGPGKYSTADEAFLPAGIFNNVTGCV